MSHVRKKNQSLPQSSTEPGVSVVSCSDTPDPVSLIAEDLRLLMNKKLFLVRLACAVLLKQQRARGQP